MVTALKQKREETGLTQEEVAKKSKIQTRRYQRYEAGERVPDVYTAQRIAKALKSTVSKIFPL